MLTTVGTAKHTCMQPYAASHRSCSQRTET